MAHPTLKKVYRRFHGTANVTTTSRVALTKMYHRIHYTIVITSIYDLHSPKPPRLSISRATGTYPCKRLKTHSCFPAPEISPWPLLHIYSSTLHESSQAQHLFNSGGLRCCFFGVSHSGFLQATIKKHCLECTWTSSAAS